MDFNAALLEETLATYPTLGRNGFSSAPHSPRFFVDDVLLHQKLQRLTQLIPMTYRTTNRRDRSCSYSMKHDMEYLLGPLVGGHVSNGELILAMILLGHAPICNGTLNADFRAKLLFPREKIRDRAMQGFPPRTKTAEKEAYAAIYSPSRMDFNAALLEETLATYPTLGRNGFSSAPHSPQFFVDDVLLHQKLQRLTQFIPMTYRTTNRRDRSCSYSMKHDMEYLLGPLVGGHVSNGELILAMILLGHAPICNGTLNADFRAKLLFPREKIRDRAMQGFPPRTTTAEKEAYAAIQLVIQAEIAAQAAQPSE